MKTSPLERKNEAEKVRRKILTLFNKSDNLRSNGAKVYSIVEYNGKLFIYNSSADKEWPPSKPMLVSDVVVRIFSMKGRLTASRRDIILFRHGALQMISVEEENGEKRNLEEDKRRLRFNCNNGESEEQ